MILFRNPLVWLRRICHRRGYGIHSPFAFMLVTQVLYSPGRYYADRWLGKLHPWYVRWFHLRPLARHRLLFRLANRWQPRVIVVPGVTPVEWNYLHEGCRRALIDSALPRGQVDMMVLRTATPGWQDHVGPQTLLVVDNLPQNRHFWQTVLADSHTRVTFDLHDLGLAVFNPKLQRQDYLINW
ncbi:MAG: hypothetical protein IJ064_02845 [Bacteroidaceae bacterium]|nr:hypothetical protein [Bacteroidaceae bacterium]